MIEETTANMKKAETAILRTTNDRYRKVIFNAQTYANSRAGTYEKAVDMATNDYLRAGINCIEYKNGRRVTASSYADMAIRTANKRTYLQGEGRKRQEWGITTVIVNHRGSACPMCMPFEGKVFIDDVWSGGKASDGPYPLLSSAIEQGLYHPNCKDSHTTYFPGVSEKPKPLTRDQKQEAVDEYNRQQKLNYYKRQEEACRREAEGSLDNDKKTTYAKRENAWKGKANEIERGVSGKNRVLTSDNIVDLDYINSNEYKRKFSNITDDKKVNDEIFQRSKDMLINRNGTNKEDLYLISAVDGKTKGRSVHPKNDDEVEYNKSLINAIKNEHKGTLISVHNHATNLPPTGSDFCSAGKHGYKFGIVPCHNGDVYMYSVGEKCFTRFLFDGTVEKYKKMGYNKGVEAYIMTLKQFEKDYGVKWRKI